MATPTSTENREASASLTLKIIYAKALEIVDEEGIENASAQKIAVALGEAPWCFAVIARRLAIFSKVRLLCRFPPLLSRVLLSPFSCQAYRRKSRRAQLRMRAPRQPRSLNMAESQNPRRRSRRVPISRRSNRVSRNPMVLRCHTERP